MDTLMLNVNKQLTSNFALASLVSSFFEIFRDKNLDLVHDLYGSFTMFLPKATQQWDVLYMISSFFGNLLLGSNWNEEEDTKIMASLCYTS